MQLLKLLLLLMLSDNKLIIRMVPLKGNVALAHIFSQVNWSTRGEQRVEEMTSQANT